MLHAGRLTANGEEYLYKSLRAGWRGGRRGKSYLFAILSAQAWEYFANVGRHNVGKDVLVVWKLGILMVLHSLSSSSCRRRMTACKPAPGGKRVKTSPVRIKF